MRVPTIAALVAALTLGCHSPAKTVDFTASHGNAARAKSEYQDLLKRYVRGEGVDYERWHKSTRDIAALDRYLALVTRDTPTATPAKFASSQLKLAYWIDLYNALVIREVLRRWPLDSVRDVRPSFFRPGKGFFAELRFRVGGKVLSLDDIEHKILRSQFKDARIHFAINCGSASCPVLDSSSYSSGDVEQALNRATRAFINQPANIRVDDKEQEIIVSKIFKWYEDDFVRSAQRALGTSKADVLDFIVLYSDPKLSQQLRRARQARYDIEYSDYDWSVNKEASAQATLSQSKETMVGVQKPLPELELPLVRGGVWRSSSSLGKIVIVDVWATYCKPCRKSIPELVALANKYPERLEIVAIGVDESRQQMEDFLGPDKLTSRVLFAHDPEQALVGKRLRISTLPTEIIVDKKGVVVRRVEGAADAAQLVKPLLQRP